MENNTKYHFLGETYDNVSDFTLALANNYADALNFIYQDEVELWRNSRDRRCRDHAGQRFAGRVPVQSRG